MRKIERNTLKPKWATVYHFGVFNIKQDNIEPAPNFGANVHTDYILGIGKIGDSVKILLNIEKVLSEEVVIAEKIGK